MHRAPLHAVHSVPCRHLTPCLLLGAGGGGAGRSGFLLLLPAALAAFLCNWQLERRAWKQDLLERRQAAMQVGS